jgi:hypothetical protein
MQCIGEVHMDDKLTSALIAAAVSFLGAVLTARWQVRSKFEELMQAQYKDVLAKRIEVYPKLWTFLQTFLSDWRLEQKEVDDYWARTFLEKLVAWHSDNGVFLSEQAYIRFTRLRAVAVDIVRDCDKGKAPTEQDLVTLDKIYSIGEENLPKSDPNRHGLAWWLKNDLGSYKSPALAKET